MPPSAKWYGCAFFQPPNTGSSMVTSLMSGSLARSSAGTRSGFDGSVVVLGDDRLAFLRIEEVEIGLGDLARALGIDIGVDDRDRRLGEDRGRRIDDVELVGAEFVERQIGFVLPGEQHVAQALFGEGDGRAARAGVEHRNVGVEVGDEFLVLGFIAAGPGVGPRPCREIVPARAARGLGVRRDDFDALLDQGRPSR